MFEYRKRQEKNIKYLKQTLKSASKGILGNWIRRASVEDVKNDSLWHFKSIEKNLKSKCENQH